MILLDHALAKDEAPRSRLYAGPVETHLILDPRELESCLDRIEALSRQGLYWVIAVSYEAGHQWVQASETTGASEALALGEKDLDPMPLLYAQAFNGFEPLNQEGVERFLCQTAEDTPSGILGPIAGANPGVFRSSVETTLEQIRQGTFYQLNLTFPLSGAYFGDPKALYRRLKRRQPTEFNALWLDDRLQLLSFSPEWFLSNRGGRLKAKPMKGTRPPSQTTSPMVVGDLVGDLATDPKNRAENVMIVDLLRNDLSRIGRLGSIRVPSLFETESLVDGLEQMTSTIEADLDPSVGLSEILKATFPCGSITGAPKRKAMEWIRRLEGMPRGPYCGALGWIDPPSDPSQRIGDFSMSVLIRTLELEGSGRWRMGVGAGITIDSNPEQEWGECLAKAAFLTGLNSEVGVFETMRMSDGVVLRWARHRERLLRSARELHIEVIERSVDRALGELTELLRSEGLAKGERRIRLSLNENGHLDITHHPLPPPPPATIFWARDLLGPVCMASSNPLLGHKVTHRKDYDRAWREAEQAGGFDGLFTNERNEVTEGGRCNVFVRQGGHWFTPPLASGVLPGVMRAELLASSDWRASEKVLYPVDIRDAEEIVVCNALRGPMRVQLQEPPLAPTPLQGQVEVPHE